MNDHDIAMAQAEIAARDEKIAELQLALAIALRERSEAVALLARSKTSLAEKFNDPMQDGGAA